MNTKEELKKYLDLLYEIASHNPNFDTPQNRSLVWSFAKKIVPADQQKFIDAAQTEDEKILTLNLILLKLAQQPDFSLPPDLKSLVDQYDKYHQQQLIEVEKQADKTGADPKVLYQKQLALIRQAVANTPLEPSVEIITENCILQPEETLVSLSKFIPIEKLAPLVPESPSPVVESVYLQSAQVLPQKAAALTTALKITHPESTLPDYLKIVDLLDVPESAVSQVFNIDKPKLDPLTVSLQNQFLKTGNSPTQSLEMAKQFKTFITPINLVSAYTPQTPTATPEQRKHDQAEVKKVFYNTTLEYLSLHNNLFRSVRLAPEVYTWPVYDDSQPTSLSTDQNGLFNYLLGMGKEKIQNKLASGAWNAFKSSQLGQKVLAQLGTAAVGTTAEAGAAGAAATVPGGQIVSLALLGKMAADFVKDSLFKIKRFFDDHPETLPLFTGSLGLVVLAPLGVTPVLAAGLPAGATWGLQNTSSVARGVNRLSSEMIGLAAVEIATPLIVISLIIPIIIALFLFIINSSAFVVPSGGLGFGTLFPGSGESINCSSPYEKMKFTNTATNSIASRAWHIVDGLSRGFWCYWNWSKAVPGSNDADTPFYPELFDEKKLSFNPNPSPQESTNLFWCTWLVLKSYNETGHPLPLQYQGGYMLRSNIMLQWFKDNNRFFPIDEAISGHHIQPGDVALIFVKSEGDGRPVHHVSIIWAVSDDVIQTIDSNAGVKSFTYSISTSQDSACWGSGCAMHIVGIGKQ